MTKDSSTTKESSKEEDKEEQKSEEKEVFSLSKEETSYLQDLNVTAIGDSLLLSAAPEMQKIFKRHLHLPLYHAPVDPGGGVAERVFKPGRDRHLQRAVGRAAGG